MLFLDDLAKLDKKEELPEKRTDLSVEERTLQQNCGFLVKGLVGKERG